jgi:hypothetical protein
MLLSSGARRPERSGESSRGGPESYFEEALMSTTSPAQLSYDVFVSDGPTWAGDERMPDGTQAVWSPLSSTLIFGAHDALLVDPPFTRTQIQAVGDWVERSGRRLAYIYSTHGHGDHWFGTGELARRFPGVTVYATEATIEVMRQQGDRSREQLFDRIFPGQIPESPVLAEPLPAQGLLLEGNPAVAVETAYNGVHQYISEGGGDGLHEWVRAVDEVAGLRPRVVVAGHKNKNRPDDPAILDETRQYLQDVIRLLDDKPAAREFYDQVTALYPDRLNPGVVWLGARALLGG